MAVSSLQKVDTTDHFDLNKAKQMSSEFNKLYRSIICHLQVDVCEILNRSPSAVYHPVCIRMPLPQKTCSIDSILSTSTLKTLLSWKR